MTQRELTWTASGEPETVTVLSSTHVHEMPSPELKIKKKLNESKVGKPKENALKMAPITSYVFMTHANVNR